MRLTPTFKKHRVAEPSRGITRRAEAASEVAERIGHPLASSDVGDVLPASRLRSGVMSVTVPSKISSNSSNTAERPFSAAPLRVRRLGDELMLPVMLVPPLVRLEKN